MPNDEQAYQQKREIDLDAFFDPAKEDMIQQAKQELESKVSKDRQLVERYYTSGLTFEEFARQIKKDVSYLHRLFKKYKLPTLTITSAHVERIKTEARKRNASMFCNCKECIACEILRSRMSD